METPISSSNSKANPRRAWVKWETQLSKCLHELWTSFHLNCNSEFLIPCTFGLISPWDVPFLYSNRICLLSTPFLSWVHLFYGSTPFLHTILIFISSSPPPPSNNSLTLTRVFHFNYFIKQLLNGFLGRIASSMYLGESEYLDIPRACVMPSWTGY